MTNIGFQGEKGAYSEYVSKALFTNAQINGYYHFEDVFKALYQKKIHYGIIPIENSLAGSVYENFDLLSQYHFQIINECYLRIEHHLVSLSGTSFEHINTVYSHPQALAQCSVFFKQNPQLKPSFFYDTAGAAKYLSQSQSKTFAAIASTYAAKEYKLQILKSQLANLSKNYTRFLVIAPQINTKVNTSNANYKTSIAFIPKEEKQGVLFHLLKIFATRNINFLNIQSRPIPSKTFQYIFYLDIEGNQHTKEELQIALQELKKNCSSFQNYGSYLIGKN